MAMGQPIHMTNGEYESQTKKVKKCLQNQRFYDCVCFYAQIWK